MSKREKQAVVLSAVLSLALCGATSASAMHIMEGYLPPSFCVIWGVICLPFLVAGVFSIRRIAKEQRKAMLLLAMAVCLCDLLSENSLRHRQLQPYDRNGPCGHPLRRAGHGGAGNHRSGVPGNPVGPRWPDYPGCQHVQHGDRRPPGQLGPLPRGKKAEPA